MLQYLYKRQHFVLYDRWGVGFGGDDLYQNTINKISVGHLDMKPVTTVLHTCLQYLQEERGLNKDALKKFVCGGGSSREKADLVSILLHTGPSN